MPLLAGRLLNEALGQVATERQRDEHHFIGIQLAVGVILGRAVLVERGRQFL